MAVGSARRTRYDGAGGLMNSILVLDDDPLIRGLLAEWLEEAGYQVCQAQGVREALAATGPAPLALTIVDIAAPKQGCAEVLEQLRRAHPDMPVIITSGCFVEGLGKATAVAKQLGADRVLAKPFSREDLLQAVHAVLGAPARKAYDTQN